MSSENSIDAEKRLAHPSRCPSLPAFRRENSIDAEKRLARGESANFGASNVGENSIDAEKRLAPCHQFAALEDNQVKIPLMLKSV